MLRRFEHHGFTWVDLESPTADEAAAVAQEFSLGPAVVEEILSPTTKPRVDVYAEYAFAIFHFPSLRRTRAQEMTEEIDIILGKQVLITIHYRPVAGIDDLAKAFETETLLKRRETPLPVGHVLFELADRLYRETDDELAALEDTLTDIETRIFSGEERSMVATISNAGRELLGHRRVIGNHRETLDVLEQVGVKIIGPEITSYFRGIALIHHRVEMRAATLRDTLAELRETNMALLTTRQNEIVKNLTVITAIMLPLTLLANIFSMNTSLPLVGREHDFAIVLVGMLVVSVALIVYFKFRRWF